MSRKAILGLVCALAMGMATMVSAHTPEGEIFFAVQFPDDYIPQMDGDISEWDVVPETPYHIRNDRLVAPDPSILTAARGSQDPSDAKHDPGDGKTLLQIF